MLSHSPFVEYPPWIIGLYTDYCKVLKFTEYSEQNGVYLSSFYTCGPGSLATLGFPDHADENLFLETTDRATVSTIIAVRRKDEAIEVKIKVVREAVFRRCRPIVATFANIMKTAVIDTAAARCRVPYGRGWTKIARKVHALITFLLFKKDKETTYRAGIE